MKGLRLTLAAFLLTACAAAQTPAPTASALKLLEKVTVQVPERSTVTAAEPPRYDGDQAVYTMPLLSTPGHIRRSEGWWRIGHPLQEGDVIVYEARLKVTMGAEARDPRHWHVLAQVHGPVESRTGEACQVVPEACWVSPPVSLVISGGEWQIQGGYGAPGGPKSTAYVLAPFRSGEWVQVRLEVKLSRVPGDGYVSVWLNGVQRLNRGRMLAGTLYGDQNPATVGLKSGLYAGNDLTEFKEVVAEKASLSLYR